VKYILYICGEYINNEYSKVMTYPFKIFERSRKETEKMEKELQNRIARMTSDEKAKYLKDEKILDGGVNLFLLLFFLSVSAFILWLFM